ncbi:macro domain-containing protein [Bremerella sp.]|uniref:macro domain-containing protein n=1 Tax=Bremerella sp. TaxID=2795602 RepID=UPI003919A7B6
MIEFTSGDLLQSDAQYIAQGVAEGNQEGLGTGLALKISKRWPDVQSAFKKHARSGTFKGGKIWISPPGNDHPGIVYLATQPDMYHATLSYLRRALRNLVKWADRERIESIGLPKIGAGLGKLSWQSEVKPLMAEHFTESPCRFIIYEDFTLEDEN